MAFDSLRQPSKLRNSESSGAPLLRIAAPVGRSGTLRQVYSWLAEVMGHCERFSQSFAEIALAGMERHSPFTGCITYIPPRQNFICRRLTRPAKSLARTDVQLLIPLIVTCDF